MSTNFVDPHPFAGSIQGPSIAGQKNGIPYEPADAPELIFAPECA